MNQKCKAAQTNQIHFLQDLTQICTQKYNQKCNQLLNFPLHTKSHVWFISGWRPDAYKLGLQFDRTLVSWNDTPPDDSRKMGPNFPLSVDLKHENTGFKVRGYKNYVDGNVSEHGMLFRTVVSVKISVSKLELLCWGLHQSWCQALRELRPLHLQPWVIHAL